MTKSLRRGPDMIVRCCLEFILLSLCLMISIFFLQPGTTGGRSWAAAPRSWKSCSCRRRRRATSERRCRGSRTSGESLGIFTTTRTMGTRPDFRGGGSDSGDVWLGGPRLGPSPCVRYACNIDNCSCEDGETVADLNLNVLHGEPLTHCVTQQPPPPLAQ